MTDEQKIIIDIPQGGNYIEILGHRIDGFESFEAFLEYLKTFAELEEKVKSQQAEIERLSDRNHKCIYLSDEETTEYCVDAICPQFKTEKQIKAEAIKEFAEKLKEKLWSPTETWLTDDIVTETQIDEVLKEMVGGTDG